MNNKKFAILNRKRSYGINSIVIVENTIEDLFDRINKEGLKEFKEDFVPYHINVPLTDTFVKLFISYESFMEHINEITKPSIELKNNDIEKFFNLLIRELH